MKAAELQQKIKAAAVKLQEAAGLKDDDDRAETLVTEGLAELRECAEATVEPEVRIQEKVVEKPVAASGEEADHLAARLRETEQQRDEAVAKAKDEKKRRKLAEAKVETHRKAKLANTLLREAKLTGKTAEALFDELMERDSEDAMRRLVEAEKAKRDELFAELRESHIEGAGARVPHNPAPTGQGSDLLGHLGLDPADYGLATA